ANATLVQAPEAPPRPYPPSQILVARTAFGDTPVALVLGPVVLLVLILLSVSRRPLCLDTGRCTLGQIFAGGAGGIALVPRRFALVLSSSSSSTRSLARCLAFRLALPRAVARSVKSLPATPVILRLCLGLSSSSSSSRSLGDCFALTLALASAVARTGKSLPV